MNKILNESDQLLIICSDSYKKKFLEELSNEKKIVNVSFMSLAEYRKNWFFDYGIKAVRKVMEKENVSCQNAEELISKLLYIDKDKNYGNEKLDRLAQICKYLEEEDLLTKNPLFKKMLAKKKIKVVGYGQLQGLDKEILKDAEIVPFEYTDKKYTINTFENIEEEVEFVYDSIFDLLKSGADINHIFLMVQSEDYTSYFKRFNECYPFKVDCFGGESVFGTSTVNEFIEMLNKYSREEIYESLKEKEGDLPNKLIGLLNRYVGYNPQEVKDQMIFELKEMKISEIRTDIVRPISMLDAVTDEDHVFLLGFNDSIPATKVDNDYLTDNIRPLIHMPSVEDENELTKENAKAYLSSIKNLVISYSKSSPFNVYGEQILFNEKDCITVTPELKHEYSEKLNRTKYAVDLDNLRKFNDQKESLKDYYASYKENDYCAYDNQFDKLSEEQIQGLKERIASHKENKDKLTLSYSSMDNYYHCAFKYYLNAVLKIRDSQGNNNTRLGTICHGVLKEIYSNPAFDFEESWQRNVTEVETNESYSFADKSSDSYFLNEIKEQLKQDIDVIRSQKANSLLNKEVCENNFNVDLTDDIAFTGFIDKIMYKEMEEGKLVAIVDYKTGYSAEIKRDFMQFGLCLQLPSYLFLLKNSEEFRKDIKFAGLYLQHLVNRENNYKNKETTLDDMKAASLRLDGISSSSVDRMQAMDIRMSAGKASQHVKGISMNQDGSLSKKGGCQFTDGDFDDVEKIVEEKILEAGDAILKGEFVIEPKIINKTKSTCSYCEYASICYKRVSNNRYLGTSGEMEEND